MNCQLVIALFMLTYCLLIFVEFIIYLCNVSSLISQTSTSSSTSCSSTTTISPAEEAMSLTDEDSDSHQPKSQCYLSANEIYTTEKSYNRSLVLLQVDFRNFVLNKNATSNGELIVPLKEFEQLFCAMTMLHQLSENIIKDLKKRLRDEQWKVNESKIGDIFVYYGDFLKSFYTYCEKFPDNQQRFLTLQQKFPKFKATINEFRLANPTLNTLESYFMQPFQRVTR